MKYKIGDRVRLRWTDKDVSIAATILGLVSFEEHGYDYISRCFCFCEDESDIWPYIVGYADDQEQSTKDGYPNPLLGG